MAYCYDIFPEQHLVFIRIIGEDSYEDQIDLIDKIADDERFIPYVMNVLVDFSHGLKAWPTQMMDRILPRLQSRLPVKRVALLTVTSPSTLMNLREMAYRAREHGRDAAAFDCPLAAFRWLWTEEPIASIDKRCVLHTHASRQKALR